MRVRENEEFIQPAEATGLKERSLSKSEQAILATLEYHDLLGLPLTSVEIWRYLFAPKDEEFEKPFLGEIEIMLNLLLKKEIIGFAKGYYFIPGRKKIVKRRVTRHALTQKKWKRLRRVAWFMQALPFLEMVAASGSLSREFARDESDLDVLLVTTPGRIWTARFFVTVTLDIVKIRRRPEGATRDRVCLNHYLTSDALLMPYQSLYSALEYQRLIPLWGQETGKRFKEVNGKWMAGYLVSPVTFSLPSKKAVSHSLSLKFIKRSMEIILRGKMGDFLESYLGSWQSRQIEKSSRQKAVANKGRIVASATRLEFHPRSREAPLLDAYNQRMRARGLAAFGGQRDSGLYS